MNLPQRFHIMLYLVFIVPYLYYNIRLSHEISLWIQKGKKRVLMYMTLWLLPIYGAVVVYRKLELDWFKHDKEKNKPDKK